MNREDIKTLQERASKAVKLDKEIDKISNQIADIWNAKSIQVNFDKSKINNSWQTSIEDNKDLVTDILMIIDKHLQNKSRELEEELKRL